MAQRDARRGRAAQYQAAAGLDDLTSLYIFCFAVFALAVVLLWRLVHSPFGRVLSAIRQNETRARFVGYNVWLYKWLAFTLSALVAGLAGGLFALAQQSAYPNVMSLQQSGFVVMMTLVGGGLVSFWGPVLGAVLFFVARDLLGAYTEAWLLWYGLLFMLVVLFKPEGWLDCCAKMFEATHLHKRFGYHVVLEDVSMSFAQGRLTGIMGPNGAGKTTCFNLLTGRYRPDRGPIAEGRDITALPPRHRASASRARSRS